MCLSCDLNPDGCEYCDIGCVSCDCGIILCASTHVGVSRGLWPRERGSYCRFVLHKTNTDTMEAVSVLSRLLKIKSSCFHFAGTKDKRAVTSQLVTAFKVTAQKLQALNTKLRNMKIGNYE